MKQIPRLDVEWIDPEATAIVQALQRKGYISYLVGGCVRDLLLGKHPKDYDIATDARPQEVKRNVPHCFIIGKRFRLVLAKRGERQFEIATFRRDPTPDEITEDNQGTDNLFGTPEEDARRRDFTINALFYDPIKHALIDYANGLEDLQLGVVRMIGDPDVRLVEDPIRILRGIRLSQMIRFALDPDLRRAMKTHAHTLVNTALPRRREEFLKFLRLEDPTLPFLMCHDFGLIEYILPTFSEVFNDPERLGVFMNHLRLAQPAENATPVELFAGLVQAYIRTVIQPDPDVHLSSRDTLENAKILHLMRDELGMFKNEQMLLAKAFDLQHLLMKRKEFERRGERRRRAVVAHPAFQLALQIAKRDFTLSPSDFNFWLESFHNSPTEAASASQRRRRRQRRNKTESAPSDSKTDPAHTREEPNRES